MKTEKVSYSDREINIEVVRIALGIVDIFVDYPTTELISKIIELGKNRGLKLTIDDIVSIQKKWQTKWDAYFENDKKY